MKCPTATYRVQLSPEFTFDDLEKILDYLEQFRISTIYSAPFFKSRTGSTHGYDITDPLSLNPEIGKLETFRKISEWLEKKKMGWLQDIVPNHMAFDNENQWLRDIFELGPKSEYYKFFDIDWEKGEKLMAPFLGDPLNEVREKKELKLQLAQTGLCFRYYDNSYPASAETYFEILSKTENEKWIEEFRSYEAGGKEWHDLKNLFLINIQADHELDTSIQSTLKKINSSQEEMQRILDLQFFRPTDWKKTEKEINYRRFFTINGLICLRMEDEKVFKEYHEFIHQLVEAGFINGLRIDHIDGLFDPVKYLEDLRELVGYDFYLIIEKILEWDEKLPRNWPVQGTSGYGFLAEVNQLFTDHSKEKMFSDYYDRINPEQNEYEQLVYNQKLFILKERMGGEFSNLWSLLDELGLLAPENRTEKVKEALGAFLAAFPVYRIYPEEFPLKKKQKKFIETACETALKYSEDLKTELKILKEIFLGEASGDTDNMFYFLQRCQQFTGPLAAKGVEDTSFYIFNRLISHNEVGDSPQNFGLSIDGFHEKMEQRKREFPLSINATATHDTKRGEDARMRINVLSELGEEWLEKAEEWSKVANKIKKNGIPDANEEYFIFQMLVGSFPFKMEFGEEFIKRTHAYLEKALREAKVHSSWTEPDESYEKEVFDFVTNLLNEKEFLNLFLTFQKKIMGYGALKSLGQCLIKLTAPGIPDIYQGTELWDLSYVDPDNRRPVNFQLRKEYLYELMILPKDKLKQELNSLRNKFTTGKIKLYCLHKALDERRNFSEVFLKGEYLPVTLNEKFEDKVVAFVRKEGEKWYLIVVPVMVTSIFKDDLALKTPVENEPVLSIPSWYPRNWKNIYTQATWDNPAEFSVKDLFGDFPVALLTNFYEDEN
ncbi:malto-oligosyltrehalose synthase [Salinimicrobium gaetbulicola]|uniref:Malto-oligosyltrehalose synthase n=1 Tax=Salinimicrobium gaetbulicola TaxID=999702 RepID=A0ABW3IDH2_9FLAO